MIFNMNHTFDYHSFGNGVLWASRGNRVYYSLEGGREFFPYIDVPAGCFKAKFSLLNRLLRQGIHNVLPLGGGEIVVLVKGKFLFINRSRITHVHHIERGSRPLKSGICVTEDGKIIYGDYWSNPDREPVRLNMSTDRGMNWKVIWESDRSGPRHIHLVQPVKGYPDEIYFSTGDYGTEPALYRLHIPTGRVKRLGGGTQAWRMLGLIQSDNALIWGTDCEFDQNYIYRFDPQTECLDRLQSLPGPVYFTARDNRGNFYLSTAIEKGRHQRACLFFSRSCRQWHLMHCFPKDIWHPKYFGYGVIELITGQEHQDILWFNIRGLRKS